MNAILDTLLDECREKLISAQKNTPRNIAFPDTANKILVAMGMRRTGKTCLLLQTINTIMRNENIAFERFLYLNFEDDRSNSR